MHPHLQEGGITKKPLWQPDSYQLNTANIARFMSFINNKYDLSVDSYTELHNWSVENVADFWAALWEFLDVKASRDYDIVVDDLSKFPGAKWFLGTRLNFAENLLKHVSSRRAFIFKGETQKPAEMTYGQLIDSVATLAFSLRTIGVSSGDRVAAFMSNTMETAIAMLASTSIGATWSSCGTELGAKAVVDRFSQINPKILFTTVSYPYKGKNFEVLHKVENILSGLPSVEKTIIFSSIVEKPDINSVPNSILFDDFVSHNRGFEINYEQLPFDHPVYIMFSSGTTGAPKCIVQGAGGVLINHLKELVLHADLRREDSICFITSPSWMMWNWLLSSLAVGATVVLYDGNPNFPDWRTMWKLVQEKNITIFGCSASYINYLRSVGAKPQSNFDLSCLREILQTGSALSAEGFEYAYREIKADLHLNSISGGTDINGCFAAGTPIQPVYAGELQGPALGMKIKAYDDEGKAVVDQKGELVCELPTPSMPLFFINDPKDEKYRSSYFLSFPHVWRHGDWIIIHSDTGGITFLGRSDFTLKPSGVRIGPAEIYDIVEKFSEITDSVVVGQDWKGDERIILFVKLGDRIKLTQELKDRIKKALRKKASPRHVPALIIQAPDIPYTFNTKKVESAVTNLINWKPVTNRDAIVNVESLNFYERIASKLREELACT